MASELDTYFSSLARTTALDLFGESVTYTVSASEPQGSTSSSSITAIREHLTDLSGDTARPHQRASWYFSTGDVSSPKRGDTITDGNSDVWTVFDVKKPEGGVARVFARIGQVRA